MSNPVALHSYLNADLIAVGADISSPKKLFQEMARLLAMPLNNIKEKTVYHALLEREKLGSTGVGNGVALPHSRSPDTDQPVIAIITLEQAIDYESPDRVPVDIAVGLLVPEEATEEHLKLLASIAGIMSIDAQKKQLVAAREADEIIELICDWSSRAG
ncbi:MAG: PTS transporter subunit EIIA [Gammaproteobacteria bacterium]|nr:PTS transporter subunit EIIA [Gammaproteobacteria bacterium]